MWFQPPVSVMTDKPGLSISISSVERAAEQLLTWQESGPKWRLAVAACLDALGGKGTPDQARAAFVDAAKECGMWLGG
ncbi:hypothetical protein FG93_01139 [Bosea sp. LC85]|nr:hypothetical protein FG93_01139 [Bosea sp. LC85]